MKFENVGNWMKEAEEDKLVFDNREPADYLNGDDEICTLKTEDDDSDYDDDFSGELLDEVESDENELESPDNEEDAIIMADESTQKNEALNSFSDYKRFYKDLKEFRKDMFSRFPGDKHDLLSKIDDIMYVIKVMWDGERLESAQKNEAKVSNSEYDKIYSWVENHMSARDTKEQAMKRLFDYPGLKSLDKLKQYYLKNYDKDDFVQVNAILVGLNYEPVLESVQKNEALDKEKAMELIGAWKSSLMGDNGDFEMHLAKACQHADKNNLMKLEKVFPQLLQKFCAWKSSGRTDKVAQL